jgi:hypothetical protein
MVSMAPRPHAGQHRLDHRHRSKKVCGEQLVRLSLVRFLHGSAVSVTGVVDEDIHRAEPCFSLPHRLGDLRPVGDIQRERERCVRIPSRNVLDFGGISRGHNRVPSVFQHRLGEMAAQTA